MDEGQKEPKIREIKPKPPKSEQEIVDAVMELMADARKYQITGLAIAYTAADFTHTEAVISGGSFPELIGVIDQVKERVRKEWNEDG